MFPLRLLKLNFPPRAHVSMCIKTALKPNLLGSEFQMHPVFVINVLHTTCKRAQHEEAG